MKKAYFFFILQAGAIEGQIYRLTKKLIPLSPQNLIDCSSVYENHGCEGGSILGAFHYISNVGINSEADYPYAAVQVSRSAIFRELVPSIIKLQQFKKLLLIGFLNSTNLYSIKKHEIN